MVEGAPGRGTARESRMVEGALGEGDHA
jgi:hypothetical protein